MSIYDPKVTFVEPLMGFRHIGHFFSAGAHCAQLTKWPHGKKTMETFSSQQILHICASFINSFSFFTSSEMKNHEFYNKWNMHLIYEWSTMHFTWSKYQHLHQNRDACIHMRLYINYYTFMRGSRGVRVGGVNPSKHFLLPPMVFKSHKLIFYRWIDVSW